MQIFSTTTRLMPHQAAAVDKLLPIRVGALFMEMGTGKTRTAIEAVERRQDKVDHVVWFCPVSLKETIRREILKHTDCRPADIHVFDQKTDQRNVPAAAWYVVGIESMSASNRVILTVNQVITSRSMVVVDESQYIKGHRAARTCWITRIAERARYRMILTGTPISQGVQDLFAQMRFLSVKILGYRSFYSFARGHLEYHPDYPGLIVRTHNTDWLAAKIRPYVYQVTKDECLDLPDKLHETRYCSMTLEQEEVYQQAKDKILMDVDVDDFNSYTIFRLFTALQQIACGFWHVENGIMELHSKRMDLLESVVDDIPDGEKVIIWTKYVHDIESITAMLEQNYSKGCAARFFGRLSEKARGAEIARFRNGARFFVATPSCAGHGLTLNEAAYVIFYNNGFKYSERIQAEDRCHRIGQTRPVTYIDLICSETIDERIDSALAHKGNVVESFKQEMEAVKQSKKGSLKELVESL